MKTPKADPELLAELAATFERLSDALTGVEKKTMFGCDGYFRKGEIFGLIWKTGRIGVKLPDAKAFEKLMGESGSAPWKAGPMVMKSWVLVPKDWHDDGRRLKTWITHAHKQAAGAKKKK